MGDKIVKPCRNLIAIPIDAFAPSEKIPYGIFICIPGANQFIKVSHGNESLAPEKIAAYKSRGIHHLYLEKSDFAKYVEFNQPLAESVIRSLSLEQQQKINFLLESALNTARSLYSPELSRALFANAERMLKASLQILASTPNMFAVLERLQEHTDFLFTHSIAVSLFATMIAKELGWESDKILLKTAMSGLLHDIGKKEIDRRILEKPRMHLNQEEICILESHTIRGREILYKIPGITEEIIQVAAQHHEDCTGHGYPNHLNKNEISPLTRVISVADEFCDLVVKNPDSPGFTPALAMKKMINANSKRFDFDLLLALEKIVRSAPEKERKAA